MKVDKNGWIKINGEKSLPKIECDIIVRLTINLREDNMTFVPYPKSCYSTNFLLNNCTHYKL